MQRTDNVFSLFFSFVFLIALWLMDYFISLRVVAALLSLESHKLRKFLLSTNLLILYLFQLVPTSIFISPSNAIQPPPLPPSLLFFGPLSFLLFFCFSFSFLIYVFLPFFFFLLSYLLSIVKWGQFYQQWAINHLWTTQTNLLSWKCQKFF